MVGRSTVSTIALLVLDGPWGVPAALAQSATEATPVADRWSFALTPYAWFTAIKGDVATFDGAPPANIDASFNDIIDQTNFAGMLAGEARYDRFGVVFDINYLDISAKGDTPGALCGDAEMESRTLFSDIAGFYDVYRGERITLDLIAGDRL